MSVDEKISFPVGEAAQIIASELPDFPEPAGFARAWFPRQIDAGGVLVGEPRLAASHARLGAVRALGEDLIASFTPREATDGWGVRGSTILQVVTDDRPFLVDTAGPAVGLMKTAMEDGWGAQPAETGSGDRSPSSPRSPRCTRRRRSW